MGNLFSVSSQPTPVLPLSAEATDAALFDRFLAAVAVRQLADWLPVEPATILDVSPHSPGLVGHMLDAGHTVIHVEAGPVPVDIQPDRAGRLLTVAADGRTIDWLGDSAVDAVVAEGGILSDDLAAELTLEELCRVLRPHGRILLCVDSLVAGLSRLADQGRWAELADVPAADVVLVPGPDGQVTRCYWPEELHGMLAAAGFEVEWIRPRTVLAEETVSRALAVDPGQLGSLVATELALSARRQGESIGSRLVASARRTV
jgi:hypothetical protein